MRVAIEAAAGARRRLRELVFPPQCLLCGEVVQTEGALCGPCWRETPFILGPVCDLCGAPVLGCASGEASGEASGDRTGDRMGEAVTCDDCRALDRPWQRGRAVMLYGGGARRLVLGLKHGDRLDLAPALAGWLAGRAGPLLGEGALIVPVPVHWRRLVARRFNQAALLANALGRMTGHPVCPDLLLRIRATPPQDGMTVAERIGNLSGAIRLSPRHAGVPAGRSVLLVDDVMTSGATLDACARVLLAAGAEKVQVLVLARVVRDT